MEQWKKLELIAAPAKLKCGGEERSAAKVSLKLLRSVNPQAFHFQTCLFLPLRGTAASKLLFLHFNHLAAARLVEQHGEEQSARWFLGGHFEVATSACPGEDHVTEQPAGTRNKTWDIRAAEGIILSEETKLMWADVEERHAGDGIQGTEGELRYHTCTFLRVFRRCWKFLLRLESNFGFSFSSALKDVNLSMQPSEIRFYDNSGIMKT